MKIKYTLITLLLYYAPQTNAFFNLITVKNNSDHPVHVLAYSRWYNANLGKRQIVTIPSRETKIIQTPTKEEELNFLDQAGTENTGIKIKTFEATSVGIQNHGEKKIKARVWWAFIPGKWVYPWGK